ncbi:MAG: hypothetical protein D6731_09040 [Planctomycetota bacterium]|nr:MAG: hypothetical protein D6731_09040 [Planctomycetota bacterium]
MEWYEEHSLRFPVLYELALVDSRCREHLEVVYAGAAASEWDELRRVERGEAPYSDRVRRALADGKELYYRAVAFPTPAAAREALERRLAEGAPPWNALPD